MPSSKWASIDPNLWPISSMAACRYRGFLTKIAQDRFRPALFHSTTGKDRTGWAWAATLLLPGVSEDNALCEIAARVGWDRSTGTAYEGTVSSRRSYGLAHHAPPRTVGALVGLRSLSLVSALCLRGAGARGRLLCRGTGQPGAA